MPTPVEMVRAGAVDVRVTNPDKVFFPRSGATKLDLVRYYLAVMPGVMRGCADRPTTLYRWPNGVEAPEDAFYQKRVSDKGRPDELRVDLDPTPGVPWTDVLAVAPVVRDVLAEHDLTGWPKTSGKRGLHVYVRIRPEWGFTEVRRAALALAREVERRMPEIATTAGWKEERRGVFVDYNQNARDRTIAAVYSVRPVADARVSCALSWDEIEGLAPEELTLHTVPERFAERGDPWEGIDESAGGLESLHDLARRDEEGGLGDAPWPPHFPKADKEPPRVQPSRARKPRRP